jgi:hypothetical protein
VLVLCFYFDSLILKGLILLFAVSFFGVKVEVVYCWSCCLLPHSLRSDGDAND